MMKYADKIGAECNCTWRNKIETGIIKLKNMKTGEQTELKLDDKFNDTFATKMADMFGDILN